MIDIELPKLSPIDQWRLNVLRAVEAQAEDETLWNPQSIHDAYAYQSLRWLHQVIEENNLESLQNIINQRNGDI